MDFTNLDALLKRLTAQRLSGIACVMTQGQEIIYERYEGYADLESGRPLREDTVFRIYSMTKLPIYTLCMLLYERGLFLPDDPLADYFPEYGQLKRLVQQDNGGYRVAPLQRTTQVRHVLTMGVGLRYGHRGGSQLPTEAAMDRMRQALLAKGAYSLRKEIRAAEEVPMAFEPGAHWMYGFSSELAAGLCEVLTGKEIEQALKDELLTPLEMDSTGMRFCGDIPQRLSA